VIGFFFLFVAAVLGYGIFRVVRSAQRDRKYLSEAKDDAPLQLDHLPHGLRQLLRETRTLRITLEATVRDVGELRRGQLNATAEDLESFDTMLMNISRAIADWLVVVDRMPEEHRGAMRDLGADAGPIRSALEQEGYAFERKHLQRAGSPPLDERLRAVMSGLAKVETALQSTQRVYR
jgi:hypothetical protein